MAELSLTFGLSGSTESRRWLAVRPYDGLEYASVCTGRLVFPQTAAVPSIELPYRLPGAAVRAHEYRKSQWNDVSVAVFGHYGSKLHSGIFIGRHI